MGLGLLEDRRAVTMNLEATTARRNHLDVGIGILAADLCRQTDGTGLVVSKLAELDRDLHWRVKSWSAAWKLTRW